MLLQHGSNLVCEILPHRSDSEMKRYKLDLIAIYSRSGIKRNKISMSVYSTEILTMKYYISVHKSSTVSSLCIQRHPLPVYREEIMRIAVGLIS